MNYEVIRLRAMRWAVRPMTQQSTQAWRYVQAATRSEAIAKAYPHGAAPKTMSSELLGIL